MPNVEKHAPGSFCWVELATTDQPGAKVEDCDRTVERAKGMGATVTMGPQDFPGVGRLALLKDPQGAHFYVIKLTGLGH